MKYAFSLLSAMLIFSIISPAQTGNKTHRIVYDLADGDTAAHSTVLRQFNNILKVAPDASLEVVCHGKAIYMLVQDKVFFEDRIRDLKNRAAVSFKVCANSMKRYGVDKSQLISSAEIVPVAILELSAKQMEGWSYIRSGN